MSAYRSAGCYNIFSAWEKEKVELVFLYLPWWDLGTASIVSNVNGAGWPQTSVNC